MSHATEMDDVHKIAKTHAGAVLIPAAVCLGELLKCPGKDLILAVALGYEVALRIGMGIGATSHRLKGWHATGTCGSFGSAVAAAILLGLDKVKIVSALGLAGTQASGLWAFTEDGASCKKFHVQIEVETYEVAVKQCGLINKPQNVSEAQFCIPYGIVVALYDKSAAMGSPLSVSKINTSCI